MLQDIKTSVYKIFLYTWMLGLLFLIFQYQEWPLILGIAFLSYIIVRFLRYFLRGNSAGIRLFVLATLILAVGVMIRPVNPYPNWEAFQKDLTSFDFVKRSYNRTLDTKRKTISTTQDIKQTFNESSVNDFYRQGNRDFDLNSAREMIRFPSDRMNSVAGKLR